MIRRTATPTIQINNITHHTGDSSHTNPSELGLYQNEHSLHLLFTIFLHPSIIDTPKHFPSFNTNSGGHDSQLFPFKQVLHDESHGKHSLSFK